MAQDISKMETTAVEWLFEQIKNGNITSEKTDCGYLVMVNDNCFEQAKSMEKEQIITAFFEGTCDWRKPYLENIEKAEKYYKVTYGDKDM